MSAHWSWEEEHNELLEKYNKLIENNKRLHEAYEELVGESQEMRAMLQVRNKVVWLVEGCSWHRWIVAGFSTRERAGAYARNCEAIRGVVCNIFQVDIDEE